MEKVISLQNYRHDRRRRERIERNDAQFEELKALLETAALMQNQHRRAHRRPH